MKMEILKVENLSYTYGDVSSNEYALHNVSFSIESGKYISIIGHNGSGKSTLAKLIMGLLAPTGGKIFLFGKRLTAKTVTEIRQKVGIVFQNPDNQFIGSTVRDDIAFGLENRKVPHEEMDDIINEFSKKVHMEQFLDKEPTNLSGGQKQRVAIAGILAMKPELIILDEATAMLDPQGRNEISEVIKELREGIPSLTILSITHDINEAFNSDEVIILNDGNLYMKGEPKEILKDEKALKSIGLSAPFVYELYSYLIEEGINIDLCSNLEEMVNKLCQ